MSVKLFRRWPLAALTVVALGVHLYAGAIGREAVLRQQVKAREAVIASLARQKARVDTVAGKATVRYRGAKVDYAAIRDSLLKELTGNLNNDTGHRKILAPIIQACDAALVAADTALSACAKQVAVRDSIIWQQDSTIVLLKKRKPFLLRLGKPLLPFAAGVIAGLILAR